VQFGEAAIGSARTEDGSVLLRGVGEGQYELLVRGQGKHQIKLRLVTGVKSATEGRSFTVQCPPVGVSNLELDIPEKDLAVQVTPHRTSELQPDLQDATRVRAVLGATTAFTVSWQPKSGRTDLAAGLANVTDTIAVDVGDGVVHTQAVFDYQILRGALSELLVEVPADHRLLDVQVPGLRDWQTEAADDRQRLTVRLHAPATESVRLELHTETPIPEEAFQVGQVRAIGVARESGILAVRSAEEVGLEYVLRESITRVDAADAPFDTDSVIAVVILRRSHRHPPAKVPSNSPSSSSVQAGGTSPDKPIGTASPTTTAIPRWAPDARRQAQAASSTAATTSHCRVRANVPSCSPITSSPVPPSRRKRIASPPGRSSPTRRERRARSPRWMDGGGGV
jgi:hypothetical protein